MFSNIYKTNRNLKIIFLFVLLLLIPTHGLIYAQDTDNASTPEGKDAVNVTNTPRFPASTFTLTSTASPTITPTPRNSSTSSDSSGGSSCASILLPIPAGLVGLKRRLETVVNDKESDDATV